VVTTNPTATIQPGLSSEGFGVAGLATGTDLMIVSAPAHGPDTVEITVDRGRTAIEGWSTSLRVGDSAAITLRPVNPDSTIADNAAVDTDFTLSTSGHVAFSDGSSPVTVIRVLGGRSRSPTYWVKGILAGTGSATFTSRDYHSNRLPITVDPPPGFFIATLGAGGHHMCGLDAEGDAYCWGRNNFNQLGTPIPGLDRSRPAPVQGGIRFTALDGTHTHTCALGAGGQAYCWGYGSDGRLGHGTDASKLEPTPVGGATTSRR
jgi:hypothetical protein